MKLCEKGETKHHSTHIYIFWGVKLIHTSQFEWYRYQWRFSISIGTIQIIKYEIYELSKVVYNVLIYQLEILAEQFCFQQFFSEVFFFIKVESMWFFRYATKTFRLTTIDFFRARKCLHKNYSENFPWIESFTELFGEAVWIIWSKNIWDI